MKETFWNAPKTERRLMESAPCFDDEDILIAWLEGNDTVDMATMFWRTEAEMYQRLHRILEKDITAAA